MFNIGAYEQSHTDIIFSPGERWVLTITSCLWRIKTSGHESVRAVWIRFQLFPRINIYGFRNCAKAGQMWASSLGLEMKPNPKFFTFRRHLQFAEFWRIYDHESHFCVRLRMFRTISFELPVLACKYQLDWLDDFSVCKSWPYLSTGRLRGSICRIGRGQRMRWPSLWPVMYGHINRWAKENRRKKRNGWLHIICMNCCGLRLKCWNYGRNELRYGTWLVFI